MVKTLKKRTKVGRIKSRSKRALKRNFGRSGGSKTPISKLKKKLWKVFSKYIRERDNYTCFTCGKQNYGKGMHAGHFIPKSVGGMTLYFHEENVRAQCYHCNINLGGNQYIYGKKLGKKAEELYKLKNNILKVDEQWYLDKIKYYEDKLSTGK